MSTQTALFAAFEHIITESDVTEAVVQSLDDLDDDAFLSLVMWRLDPLPTNKAIWKALCHPALIDRTLGCLEELADEMGEDAHRRALPAAHGKVRRLNLVEDRIRMAKGTVIREPIRDAERVRTAEEYLKQKLVLKQLALAVNAHRLACIEQNLTPEPHDLALWEALDELRLPEGREGAGPSLAEQIASGRWYHAPMSTSDLVEVDR